MILSRKQLWRRVKSYPIKENNIDVIFGIPKQIKRVEFNKLVYYRLIPTNNELKEFCDKSIQSDENDLN
jgi:hypothetical protein